VGAILRLFLFSQRSALPAQTGATLKRSIVPACAYHHHDRKGFVPEKNMQKTFLALLPALAIAGAMMFVVPASAQPEPQSGGQCLRSSQIDSFSSIKGDERSMIVIDRFRNRYKLGFNAVCDDIDFTGAVAIRTLSNTGLSCIQRGDMVITRSVSGWQDRCVITRVQLYTAAMQKADAQQAAANR